MVNKYFYEQYFARLAMAADFNILRKKKQKLMEIFEMLANRKDSLKLSSNFEIKSKKFEISSKFIRNCF